MTNVQFNLNGISYPSNWCSLSTPDELNALGIYTLSEVYPTLTPASQYYDGHYVDDFTALTRTYNVVDMTTEQQTAYQASLLSKMDVITEPYGVNLDLSLYILNVKAYNFAFTGGTGALNFLLPTGTNATIGCVFIIDDLDCICSSSPITIDAGVGNNISYTTVAQTIIINTNGGSITLKKVTSTIWRVQ